MATGRMRRAPVSSDKRFRRNKTVQVADHGTAERWQHGARDWVATEVAGMTAARAAEECALDSLHRAGVIDTAAHDAGLRLRGDFEAGRVGPRLAGSYSPWSALHLPAQAREDRSPAQERAYRRWSQAIQAVGPQPSPAVVSVCCMGLPLYQRKRLC